uniref:Uncharacterized protein n=1 Tax=Lepeophtheirus salmonis TaxID=72036 RepID=A0A0K2UIA8_LEPSM
MFFCSSYNASYLYISRRYLYCILQISLLKEIGSKSTRSSFP